MATVYWNPNSANVQEVDTITIGGAAAGGNTIFATINTKNVTYTLTASDTNNTAASGLQALLSASTAPPEFAEISWTVVGAVITGTSTQAGRPFTLTSGATGTSTATHAVATANVSQSDVNNANNWLRAGVAALPQNGDDMIIANSSVPLLWNLASLSAVQLNSYTRWQNFTGTIGLPEINPSGYIEYRPTYFKFTSAGTLTMTLGIGSTGRGPTRERYDVGATQVILLALAAGSPQDDYQVRFLGSNASNTIQSTGVSVGVAMNPGETATIASATVEGNTGLLALGTGVTFSGALTADGAQAIVDCNVGSYTGQNGSSATFSAPTSITYAGVTAKNNSTITWLTGGVITSLTLQTNSTFDKSQNTQALTVTNSTQDGDSTFVLDPWGAITWTNAITMRNNVPSGPVTFPAGKTVKIT